MGATDVLTWVKIRLLGIESPLNRLVGAIFPLI